jgi:hypothetical protein
VSVAVVVDHDVALRVGVSVWTGDPVADEPAYMRTVTVAESSAALPAAPDRSGVPSLVGAPSPGTTSVGAGATQSAAVANEAAFVAVAVNVAVEPSTQAIAASAQASDAIAARLTAGPHGPRARRRATGRRASRARSAARAAR